MIEFCSKKRMLAGIILLGGLTVIVLIYESQWAFEASSYNHFANYSNISKNLTDSDFCWLNEEYSVIESCHPCSDFEVASKSNKACIQTHFKEAVKCHKSGKQVFRSCDKVLWLEEKKFWQFEVLVFFIAITSSASVFLRQRVLDQQHLKTLQRRLACSVLLMGKVYLEISNVTGRTVKAPIESAICLCIYDYLECPPEVTLKLVKIKSTSSQITLDLDRILFKECPAIPAPASYCTLPVFESHDNLYCIAGLSAVIRQIVRCAEKKFHSLLGFREACLVSCAETSVWTKFCELELIAACKTIINNACRSFKDGLLPLEIARLEAHMSLPIRVHNVGKLKDKSHKYAEGPYFLLTDLVLALPVHIILNTIGCHDCSQIPLIHKWYLEVVKEQNYQKSLSLLHWEQFELWTSFPTTNWILPKITRQSLYKRDPTRYKPRDKIYTQQNEIEDNLNKLENVELLDYTEGPKWEESWADQLPIPEVPNKRVERKKQQLANLAAAAVNISSEGDTIVDFCCGSGHLGLILAYCLPKCSVILLDNKEKSLDRARKRLISMNLSNVYVLQANLDYFIGKFQVGVSLHACGVASDLVIHKCLRSEASFIVCPCCYGGIQENHILSYPQSREYLEAGMSQRGYIVLGHCADQSGSDQGERGMRAVDTDRCLLARNNGYYVTLSKLVPQSCTTRNNIIIAIRPSNHHLIVS